METYRKDAKVYVKVLSETDENGQMLPRQITWEYGRSFDIDRVGLDVLMILPRKSVADIADIRRHIGNTDCFTARFRFNLLEVQHRGQGVTSLPDQGSATRHIPACSMAGV